MNEGFGFYSTYYPEYDCSVDVVIQMVPLTNSFIWVLFWNRVTSSSRGRVQGRDTRADRARKVCGWAKGV